MYVESVEQASPQTQSRLLLVRGQGGGGVTAKGAGDGNVRDHTLVSVLGPRTTRL